jgi:Spy/CpxP family protein refolding chaperone
MDKLKRNTWLVRAAAVLIFLLGFAAGALAPRAYRAWTRDGARSVRDGGGRLDELSERLNLSPEQKEQVQQIFGDTRSQLEALRKESEPRFAEIRRRADERLQGVLTPEQWEQFKRTREETRKRGHGGRGGGDGSRSPGER